MANKFINLLLLLNFCSVYSIDFPGPKIGIANGNISGSNYFLENNVIQLKWTSFGGKLIPLELTDKLSGNTMPLNSSEFFKLILPGNVELSASDFSISKLPNAVFDILPANQLPKASDHIPGKKISFTLINTSTNLTVDWEMILLDGSNYIVQSAKITNQGADLSIGKYHMLVFGSDNAQIIGEVDGSPVKVDNFFFGIEAPRAVGETIQIEPNVKGFQFYLPRATPLDAGTSFHYSSVMGVFPEGQMRRGFLYYLERERARPYKHYLHYNTWYDIAFTGCSDITYANSMQSIIGFGDSLVVKRNVNMDGFVIDDGWDNLDDWGFNSEFPNGFTDHAGMAKKYNSALGTWLSPWGGYGGKKTQRVNNGINNGYEINSNGLSLAGPNYYERYLEVCLKMINDYGVNFFKFDGVGDANMATGARNNERDIDAIMRLQGELRLTNPDVFIETTVGSWPSPFWVLHTDAVWRQSEDTGLEGEGNQRQRWINYRDARTYHNIVKRGPLYPLTSLMNGGMQIAKCGGPKGYDMDETSIKQELRSFFATGTQLQEMYITASWMTSSSWDIIAEAAKWSESVEDIMVDIHWVGGDPAAGEIYGFASWSLQGGTLFLRNPTNSSKSINLDIGKAFELPLEVSDGFTLKSPWLEDANKPEIKMKAGVIHLLQLSPQEVLVFDAVPDSIPTNIIRGTKIKTYDLSLKFIPGGVGVSAPNGTEIFIYGADGKLIKSSLISDSKVKRIYLNGGFGMYIVNAIFKGESIKEKFILNE